MKHTHTILVLIALCVATATCGKTAAKATEETDAVADVPAADAAADVAPVDAIPEEAVPHPLDVPEPDLAVVDVPIGAPVGAPCGSGKACAAGLLCAPFPGGYCTRSCSEAAPCPSGAVCAPTLTSGTLCASACDGPASCRSGGAYTCDTGWGACVVGAMHGPKPPVCAQAEAPLGAFSKPSKLGKPTDPGVYAMEPAAATLADGRLVVLYMAMTGLWVDDTVMTWPPGGLQTGLIDKDGKVLTSGAALPIAREHAFDPWLASDRAGAVHGVWLEYDGLPGAFKKQAIAYARTTDGAAWTAPKAIHDPSDCAGDVQNCLDKPMIVVGPNPKDPGADLVHVLYTSEVTGGLRVVTSADGGHSFGPAVGPILPGTYGDAEAGLDGSLHAAVVVALGQASSRLGTTMMAVRYTRSLDGGKTWSAPTSVSGAGELVPFYFSNAQLAAEYATTRVFVVYPRGGPDLAWSIVLAASDDGGKTWTRNVVSDGPDCPSRITPTIARDPQSGALLIAWKDNRSGAGAWLMRKCSPEAVCEPTVRISDSPFASFQLLRNEHRWLGEYDVLLLDAAHGRLHSVWTQPVLEDGAPWSRVWHASRVWP